MLSATIITDGSADNRNGNGGWAVIVRTDSALAELAGYAESTTSNRMELTAAIEGLKALKTPHKVDLIADSSYLLRTLKNQWYQKWLTEVRSKPRPNMDLWAELDALTKFHDVTFIKVKGHSGDYWNERADTLAKYARKNKAEISNELTHFKDVRCTSLSISGVQCKLHLGHAGKCYHTNSSANGVEAYGVI